MNKLPFDTVSIIANYLLITDLHKIDPFINCKERIWKLKIKQDFPIISKIINEYSYESYIKCSNLFDMTIFLKIKNRFNKSIIVSFEYYCLTNLIKENDIKVFCKYYKKYINHTQENYNYMLGHGAWENDIRRNLFIKYFNST